jgi:hypothetical protein
MPTRAKCSCHVPARSHLPAARDWVPKWVLRNQVGRAVELKNLQGAFYFLIRSRVRGLLFAQLGMSGRKVHLCLCVYVICQCHRRLNKHNDVAPPLNQWVLHCAPCGGVARGKTWNGFSFHRAGVRANFGGPVFRGKNCLHMYR